MKKEELMLGDWVYNTHNRQNEQVAEIGSGLVMLDYNDLYDYDEIEPIPLTAEILEKNGFKRDPLWHHCDKDFGDYTIYVQLGYANKIEYIKIAEKGVDNVIPSERTKMYLTHIKYVHELQRALRLCGIEKEKKLSYESKRSTKKNMD